jgi:hypothetical protein
MTVGHLTREEGMEAGGKAQRIQKAINTAIGRQFVRCSAPMRFRPRDVSNPDQDVRYGLELRIEPLVAITDFRGTACPTDCSNTAGMGRAVESGGEGGLCGAETLAQQTFDLRRSPKGVSPSVVGPGASPR